MSLSRTIWHPFLIGALAIFFVAVCLGMSKGRVGAKADGSWRIEVLRLELSAGESEEGSRSKVAVPLWTQALALVAGTGEDGMLTTERLRYANCFALLLLFPALMLRRPKSLEVLFVGFLAWLTAAHGAIPGASYDAYMALLVVAAIRAGGLYSGIVATVGVGLFLTWGNQTATWDVVNLYAALGLHRQPFELTDLAYLVPPVLAVGLWAVARKSGGTQQGFAVTAIVILGITLFSPGMVRGVEWLCLAFFFEAYCRDRKWLAPTLGLGLVLFLDGYGLLAFNHMASVSPFPLPGASAGWTMPSFWGSFLIKCALLMLALRRLKTRLVMRHSLFRGWEWASSVQSIATQWDQYRHKPVHAWRPGFAVALSLTVGALLINFHDLGGRNFPTKGYEDNGEMIVSLRPGDAVASVWIAHLAGDVNYRVTCGGDVVRKNLRRRHSLSWAYLPFDRPCTDSITVAWQKKDAIGSFTEILLADAAHQKLTPQQTCVTFEKGVSPLCEAGEASLFFDENADLSGIPLPENGAILDEFYNAGPGAGVILGLQVEPTTKTSHPYLGRWLIYQSMKFFGTGPFGWRLPSAIASALLPLLVFFLARLVLLHEEWATFAAALSFVELVRIGSGRTAYVDTQVTAFIMLHYIFLLMAIRSRCDLPRTCLFMLATWISLGAAASTKWLGVFPLVLTAPISAVLLVDIWRRTAKKIVLVTAVAGCCLLPAVLYVAPYLPFVDKDPVQKIAQHQELMLFRHGVFKGPANSSVEVFSPTHPSAAGVTDWLYDNVNYRALLIPFGPSGARAIYIFGNPILWWALSIALVVLLAGRRRHLSIAEWVVVAAYFAQVLPWFFIQRYSFPYHYMAPATLGAVLIPAAVLHIRSPSRQRYAAIAVAILAATAFLLFLPATLGVPLSEDRIGMMRWFERWFFEFG